MKTDSILERSIKEDLKKKLSEKRYRHTIGVVEAAIFLAEKYGVDEYSARLASLLHDYCKNMDRKEYRYYIDLYDIVFDDIAIESTELMHGKLARYIAKEEYGITDEDILNAIEYHTTGRKGMSILEKIVALADYIEEGRDFPGVEEIRDTANRVGLDEALLQALNGTLRHLIQQNHKIHPDTIEARNDLIGQIQNKQRCDNETVF